MTTEEAAAWLILNASGLSPLLQRRLVETCGTPCLVLGATDQQLLQTEGIQSAHVAKLRDSQRHTDLVKARQCLQEHGVSLLSFQEDSYPRLLQEMEDRPPLLFVQGQLTRDDELAVALVGTRKASPYGLQVARRLAQDLAQRGFTIVSGMALGIDAEAHEGALQAGGRSIAVMGTGADITYPPQHRELRQRLAETGAVLTELALGSGPTRYAFPARNRIIAGLCRGVVIVEAPQQSGALITATLAAELGREVFAVPGRVDEPRHRGAHQLLKEGAALVEVAEDVVQGLGINVTAVPSRPDRRRPELSQDELVVYDALSTDPRRVDQLALSTGMDAAQINVNLMLLEVKGLARRFAGGSFVRVQ